MSRQYLGKRKEDGAKIYLTDPEWDCGWYWSFGYLGNINEHYHLDSYQKKTHFITDKDGKFHMITEQRDKNMRDCLLEDYDLAPNVKENLWTFCELILTAYVLIETAETLLRGGYHMTTNPCAELIKNEAEVKRINNVVLPTIFKEIDSIFKGDNQ